MSAEAWRLPRRSSFGRGQVQAVAGCYFVAAFAARDRPRTGIVLGFACIALGLAGHGVAYSLGALIAVRLVLGVGLTLGLVSLSALAAECAEGRAPGGLFGALEFFSKAVAVAAGLAAAAGSARFGPAAPVLTGSGAAALTVLASLFLPTPRSHHARWSR